MPRQQTLPEVAEQCTLTDSIDETTDNCDAADSVPTTQAALLDFTGLQGECHEV